MMSKITQIRRRSIRLPHYDYAQNGAYFVTVCTHKFQCMFGQIVDAQMELNKYGKIVTEYWNEIPRHFPHVELDAFVVMPNHMHGIIVIHNRVGATHGSPLQANGPAPGSIGAVIAQFKQAVTRRVRQHSQLLHRIVWQRNYYEHVIRSESKFNQIREYIRNNPMNWGLDENNHKTIGVAE